MKSPRIAIIDYGAGNLHSVAKAFEAIGHPANVTHSTADVFAADAVVLPGVGAAGDTMRSLTGIGMADAVRKVIADGKPFFGVCLGLQLLLSSTEEGDEECLGVFKGEVKKFKSGTLKVPHMGWNQVLQKRKHPVFAGIEDGAYFYFVHSYYAVPSDKSLVAAETEYGGNFCSAIAKDNVIATQFHPEKSGPTGLKLYKNFVNIVAAG